MKKLGNNIKYLRESNNLKQKELAEKLNIAVSTLSQYENGIRIPSDDIKIKIADYFNVTIDYLFGRSSDPQLTRKDEKDIGKKIEKIKNDLSDPEILMMYGEVMTEEDKENLQNALEIVITMSKKDAKQKFNPNKNKK